MLVDWMVRVVRFAAVASVCPKIVSREQWGAQLPFAINHMRAPAEYVVMHHTYNPGACYTPENCTATMREIQDDHQIGNEWDDIGYSFVIGGDGQVYQGRGWSRVGAHAPPFNNVSIGIALTGDWRSEAPPDEMLIMTQWLIECGVKKGYISPNYTLIGHRQTRGTQCPGDAMYNIIKKWPHWVERPSLPAHGGELRPLHPFPNTTTTTTPASSQLKGVCPTVVTREQWGAQLPFAINQMRPPVDYVVIHHTYKPGMCYTLENCTATMKEIQYDHQYGNEWDDIGYSFVIGGDDQVYEGRGWSRVGAHAPPFNNVSIGIALTGDWRSEAPPDEMLAMAQWLIDCGVKKGYISPNYTLIGHRQTRGTQCPGDGLYNIIKTWPHYTERPNLPAHGGELRPLHPLPETTTATILPPSTPTPASSTTVGLPRTVREEPKGACSRMVTREGWGGRPPTNITPMRTPVNHVVIHHTYIPGACSTAASCSAAMRTMQDMHQIKNKWDDIGYNFAVGGDGRVYVGRGWSRVGAHAPPFNSVSIGIALIGDWRSKAPPKAMLDATQSLIRCGVSSGYITPKYQLLGHRQAKDTVCPGDALFKVISKWPNWTQNPTVLQGEDVEPIATSSEVNHGEHSESLDYVQNFDKVPTVQHQVAKRSPWSVLRNSWTQNQGSASNRPISD